LVRGREVSTQKFNSERQIAFILTKAAVACPRGETSCCSIVSRRAVPNYRPERPFAIEGSLAIMNGIHPDRASEGRLATPIAATEPVKASHPCFRPNIQGKTPARQFARSMG
jgi:hypothetical protein